MPHNNQNFAVDFRERQMLERERIAQATPEKERLSYGYGRGDYSAYYDDMVVDNRTWEQCRPRGPGEVEQLRNLELFFSEYLQKQMELKRAEPVIAVDIGGMLGLSWVRLAKHFENEVKEGRIAFVVTNLTYQRHDILADPKLTPEEQTFLVNNENLVHFCNAAASNLPNLTIILPNDRTIALRAHSDLVHECNSVTCWSKIPDLDIYILGILLSPYGAYFVHEIDAHDLNMCLDSNEEELRLEGIVRAHNRLIRQLGLTKISTVEAGEYLDQPMQYIVFRQHNAPLVTVNNPTRRFSVLD